MSKKYKVGDIIYYNDLEYFGTLGIKMQICKLNGHIDNVDIYEAIPQVGVVSNIRWQITSDRIFDTKDEAILAGENRKEKRKEKYKNKIQSVKDLLLFPLNEFGIDSRCTDPEVVTVYVEKVKELFDIDLSEKF